MEYNQIKQLIDDMGNSKLSKLDIDFPDGTKISMEKEEKKIIQTSEKQIIESKDENINEDKQIVDKDINEVEKNETKSNVVKSPMVGTFYLKPSPTAEPYVEVGKTVKKGDTLCIIEAMKLMNEIESEYDGIVKEILVKDGDAVEYGKPLFTIE